MLLILTLIAYNFYNFLDRFKGGDFVEASIDTVFILDCFEDCDSADDSIDTLFISALYEF